jgi:hypothetical protein
MGVPRNSYALLTRLLNQRKNAHQFLARDYQITEITRLIRSLGHDRNMQDLTSANPGRALLRKLKPTTRNDAWHSEIPVLPTPSFAPSFGHFTTPFWPDCQSVVRV